MKHLNRCWSLILIRKFNSGAVFFSGLLIFVFFLRQHVHQQANCPRRLEEERPVHAEI